MAGFDPFANQGGPAAWDPDTPNTSRELAEKLLGEVDDAPDAAPDDAPQQQPDDPAVVSDPTDPSDPSDDDSYFSPAFTD